HWPKLFRYTLILSRSPRDRYSPLSILRNVMSIARLTRMRGWSIWTQNQSIISEGWSFVVVNRKLYDYRKNRMCVIALTGVCRWDRQNRTDQRPWPILD